MQETIVKQKLPLANCATCPLKNNKQIHFVANKKGKWVKTTEEDYENPHKADYVFMGMHADRDETYKGEALSGPAGITVRQTAIQLGLSNSVLLNAVACAPDDKDSTNEIARQKCEPAIHRLIKEINPNLLFSMGPESLRTSGILPSPKNSQREKAFKITQNNGMVEDSKTIPNQKVMPLIHPAYFLRNIDYEASSKENPASAFGDWVEALFYGKSNLANPYPKPKVVLVKTVEELKKLITKINVNEIVALDIETRSLKLFEKLICIQITHESDPYTGYVIPIPSDITTYYDHALKEWKQKIPANRQELYDVLKDFLENKNYKFMTHGGMFDIPYLMGYGWFIQIAYDTLILAHLVNENAISLGLKYQARLKLGYPEWDKRLYNYVPTEEKQQEILKKGKKKPVIWDTIPRHILYRYAGWDPVGTFGVFLKLRDDCIGAEWDLFIEELMPTYNMFLMLRFNGVKVDPEKLLELKDILGAETLALYEELHDFALSKNVVAFNPNSSPQLAELLFDKLELPEVIGRSTDRRKVLERLPINNFTPRLIEFKEKKKELTSYVFGVWRWMLNDAAIHPYYNLTLKTGRMSATDPSVLNIKKGSQLREAYVPHNEGWIVCEGDQSQCELRVLAGVTNSSRMIAAFRDGFQTEKGISRDIHGYFSKLINPSLTMEEIEKGGHRTRTKNVVFGKVYRAAIAIMAQQMMMSSLQELKKNDPNTFNRVVTNIDAFADFYTRLEDQAIFISDKLDELNPELKDFEKACISEMHKYGFVTSPTRRRRHIPLVTKGTKKHAENQAVNSPIQDTANAINWHAMRQIYDKYSFGKYKKPPLVLWFSVHDSIVSECDPKYSEEIIPEIKAIGENAAKDMLGKRYPVFNELPFVVDLKVGTNLGNTITVDKYDNLESAIRSTTR